MKILLRISFILGWFIMFACNEMESLPRDEWVMVDSLTPSDTVNRVLNIVYHNDNQCLTGFDEDTVFFMCFSSEDYKQTDTCIILPEIDFGTMTLVVGKIMEPSISYRIDRVVLFQNNFR